MPIHGSQLSFPHYLSIESIVSINIITYNEPHKIIYGQA